MLSHAVCQSILRLLASGDNAGGWSRRAVQRLHELRDEYPWMSVDATALVQTSDGEICWWTFAGGTANALIADALKSDFEVKSDNLSLSFPTASSLDSVAGRIAELQPNSIKPMVNPEALDNLKFSQCLSPQAAAEVFASRFDDPLAVVQTLDEPMKSFI